MLSVYQRDWASALCRVIVRQRYASLQPASEDEEDVLDKACGLKSESRLSCQVAIRHDDLVIEIPKYSFNLENECAH